MSKLVAVSQPLFAREENCGDTVWYFAAEDNTGAFGIHRVILRYYDRQFRNHKVTKAKETHSYRACRLPMQHIPPNTKNLDALVSQIPDEEKALALGHIIANSR